MARASSVLIPTRFLLSIGYFVLLVLAIYQKEANIAAGITQVYPTSSDVSSARSSLLAAVGLSLICVIFTLGSLLLGFTMFFDRLNSFHIFSHFFGGILTAWCLIDVWGYQSYWWIWAWFALLPALAELATLLLVLVFKVFKY